MTLCYKESTPVGAPSTAREPPIREPHRCFDATAFAGDLCGLHEPLDGTRKLTTALEVVSQSQRVLLSCCLQPFSRKRVPLSSVGVRQHRVRGVSQEAVLEPVLALAREG